MRTALKLLTAGVLAAPLLAGCVIYSNEAGETVRVNMGDAKAPAAEAIRSARFADGALVPGLADRRQRRSANLDRHAQHAEHSPRRMPRRPGCSP